MRISNEARPLLEVASEFARFRGAAACTVGDVAIAMLIASMREGAPLNPPQSTSPYMLPFDDVLSALLSADAEVGVAELRSATAEVRKTFSNLLA